MEKKGCLYSVDVCVRGCMCLPAPLYKVSLHSTRIHSHLPESHNMDLKVLPIFTRERCPFIWNAFCWLLQGPLCSRGFFSGTFGKPLRRPHLDAFSSSGQSSDCQPRPFLGSFFPDLDYESEEDGKERTDFQQENHTCTYKQTLRKPQDFKFFQSYDLDT